MAKKSKSKFQQKVAKGVQKHRGDETRMGFVDLPGGIRNGTARLVDCKFEEIPEGRRDAGCATNV